MHSICQRESGLDLLTPGPRQDAQKSRDPQASAMTLLCQRELFPKKESIQPNNCLRCAWCWSVQRPRQECTPVPHTSGNQYCLAVMIWRHSFWMQHRGVSRGFTVRHTRHRHLFFQWWVTCLSCFLIRGDFLSPKEIEKASYIETGIGTTCQRFSHSYLSTIFHFPQSSFPTIEFTSPHFHAGGGLTSSILHFSILLATESLSDSGDHSQLSTHLCPLSGKPSG